MIEISSERQQVIIVDYDADLASLFTDAIKSSGIKAIGFEKPLKAVKYVEDNHSKICLVVTGWKMSQIHGLELIKKVSVIDEKIKIMLMSAFELEEDELKELI